MDEAETTACVADALAKRDTIKVAVQAGGEWLDLRVHSLQMPDGAEWDAFHGWRRHKLIPTWPRGEKS